MNVSLLALLLSLQGSQTPQIPVTVEEYIKLKDIGSVQVSPGGGTVAFTVTETNLKASEYRTELYLWRPASEPRQVTRGRKDVRAPRWSPDGTWLAFLSDGDDDGDGDGDDDGDGGGGSETQVWVLPIAQGGEAIQLTRLAGGVCDYGWGSDSTIYVLTRAVDPALLEAMERREKEEKDDPVVVRDGAEHPREFWAVEVPGGTSEYVWGGDRGITDMAVSPGGGSIAYATNYSGATGDYTLYDIWALDVSNKETRQLTDRAGAERAPVWKPDASSIVFQAPQRPELSYSQTELFMVPVGGGTPRSLTDAFDRTVQSHSWPAGGDLTFSAALGVYTHLFAVRSSGAVERLTSGSYNHGSFGFTSAGGVLYSVRESATQAAELWRVSDEPERLTTLNEHGERWRLARQEVIRWNASDGLAVEGLLVYPDGYQEGLRYPLLVNPHGGPSSRVRDVMDQFHGYQLFAAQGYAVLAPNFRGSTGYGETFGTANQRDIMGADFADLMAGVDHVIRLGIADSTRMGIYGGSYGGYMTNWAISHTQRFKAAVSMYGIFSLITDYSNSNISHWEYDYLRGYYWEDMARYLERSPMSFVADINTPVLIIHGAVDRNTFIANSNEMYRALVDLDRTVEFVKYPRERHGIREPRHRVDLFFRQLRWFDKHIKFDSADLFDYYLVDEWVPGPQGWEMRVVSAEPNATYSGAAPESGRFLEVVLAIRPDTANASRGAGTLELDLGAEVRLLADAETDLPAAGTVTEIFGQKTLVYGAPGRVTVGPAEPGTATALAISLAFEIPPEAAEYRLQVGEFSPVRIWAGPDN